jgi:hypothetical protein
VVKQSMLSWDQETFLLAILPCGAVGNNR